MLIISGPTGVGKSDLSGTLALMTNGEIINADVGQMYVPFSIGTAKPDLTSCVAPHHLFDIINQPRDHTVAEYRTHVMVLLNELSSRHRLPIIVGGSLFYIQSLLFPPTTAHAGIYRDHARCKGDESPWKLLQTIDPERAMHIHPHDTYRIQRALDIWRSTGQKPSSYKRDYNPVANGILLWVTRDRTDLHERINKRVLAMVEQGLVDECSKLIHTPWYDFINKKKLIGYNEIFSYLQGETSLTQAIALIQQRTRAYAKRQETFWRMLKNQIVGTQTTHPLLIDTINLTHQDTTLYSKKLLHMLAAQTSNILGFWK